MPPVRSLAGVIVSSHLDKEAKPMARKLAIGGIVFASVIALCAVGAAVWFLLPPAPQTGYYGLNFADGKAEVQYKMGTPPRVEGPTATDGLYKGFAPIFDVNGDPATDKSALPAGTEFRAYDVWSYANPADKDGYISVSFRKNGLVSSIKCFSKNQMAGACNPVLGVHTGDTEQSVKHRLGSPSNERLEGPTKSTLYQALNAVFDFEKERVYMITVGKFVSNQPK
jgi:hypothetical protein